MSADWVRCDERLPDEGWYLVTIKFSSGPIVRSDRLMLLHGHKVWVQFAANPVIAWRPLPDPYLFLGDK